MKLLLIAAALAAGPAFADDFVYKDESVTIRLMDKPCARPSLATALSTVSPGEAKAAAVRADGKDLIACWTVVAQLGAVAVVDEQGMGGFIPMDEFKRVPGI
jgi:hypothetical protein